MRISIYCFFCGIIILVSCKQERQHIIKRIAGNESKYWDVKYETRKGPSDTDNTIGIGLSKLKMPYSSICFDVKGKYRHLTNFYKNGILEKRLKDEIRDVVLPEEWYLLSDSIISLNGLEYSIIRLSDDTFIYSRHFEMDTAIFRYAKKGEKAIDSVVLVKSKYQFE